MARKQNEQGEYVSWVRSLVNPATWPEQKLYFRGFWRLVKILVGWRADSSQEIATNWLMLIGFAIEGFILWQVVFAQARTDLFHDARIEKPLMVFLFFVLFFLLFHQFAIFRNFALPREAAHRRIRLTTADIIRSVSDEDRKSAIDKLRNPSVEIDTPSRSQRFVEILIYALFGVLTGEAGYMLTVLHEHHANHWTALMMWKVFGTETFGWGLTLECAFLLCAMIICLLVLLWDVIVSLSTARAQYRGQLPMFVLNDILSLLFWLSLFALVTPTARWMLGATTDLKDPTKSDLGNCFYVWLFLVLFSFSYIFALLTRFTRGLWALGTEKSYDDARFKEV